MFEFLRPAGAAWATPLQVLINVVDILVVAYVNYRILKLVRGTRAWRVVGGLLIFVGALFLSDFLQLNTLHWLLDKATVLAPVAVVLLLLPEMRQALEGVAKIGLWPERLPGGSTALAADTVEEVVAACTEMSAQAIGALIVLERTTNLDDVAANGVQINAQVSAPLLGAIFYHGNPLHDGAVVIRKDKVLAAAARLPLSESDALESHFHMRHRAAAGISEQADCVVVVVSEERGTISVAMEGVIHPIVSNKELRELLNRELRGAGRERKSAKKNGGPPKGDQDGRA